MGSDPGANFLEDPFVREVMEVLNASADDSALALSQLKRIFHKKGMLVPNSTMPGQAVNTKLSADVRPEIPHVHNL